MERSLGRNFIAALLVGLFISSVTLSFFASPPQLTSEEVPSFTQLNQQTTISVTTHPDGTSNALQLEVPINEAVTDLGLSLEPHILPRSESISWSLSNHWNMSGTSSDMVDYNTSGGLRVLPRQILWDFEASNHGWTLGTGWYWGYDSCLGQSGGVHGGTKAIYTYNCNYPNNIPSSGYFATSPVVNCGGCSGTWELKYWKRLGIESYYYDDAQVHVKNAQGNWVTVWDWNSYSVNPSSWTQMSHDISSYANNNPNLQVRFKLGRTDGSVTYTGWNVDDVQLKPVGGSLGSGANWTSAKFGPSAVGPYQSLSGPYGVMSIDATVPSSSSLKWTVLDGTSNNPIAGFIDRNELSVDLGAIDYEKHPTLKLKLIFHQPSGSASPIVHSVHVQGRYEQTFTRDPGWTGSLSWDGDSFPGSGEILSQVFTSHRPISRIKTSLNFAGSGQLFASVDGGAFFGVATSGTHTLSTYAHSVQFKWVSTSGSADLRAVRFDLDTGGLPLDARIDAGLDGQREWELSHSNIGTWGWQDRLSTGGLSHDFNWNSATTRQVGMWLPISALDTMRFAVTPSSAGIENLDVALSVGGVEVFSQSFGTFGTSTTVQLNSSSLAYLNSELASMPSIWPPPGRQVGADHAQVVWMLSADYGGVNLGGISAVSHPVATLDYQAHDEMVWAVNDLIPGSTTSGGLKLVPLTIQMSLPGSLKATITDLNSTNEVSTDSLIIQNGTNTLAASRQWLEVVSTHTAPLGTVAAVQLDLVGARHQIHTLCRQDGTLLPVPGSGDFDMLQWDGATACSMDVNGTSVSNSLRFRLNASWDDEDSLTLKVRVVLIDGRRSVPRLQSFGVGSRLAIENDVEITSWGMFNDLGNPIPSERSYLKSDSPIRIDVNLGFIELDPSLAPRDGDVAVRVFQNNKSVANSTALVNGSISLNLRTPMGTQDAEYRVDVYSLHGQDNLSSIPLNRTFKIDSLAPMVIDQNIRRYDHLEPSLTQQIRIEVYDRPILPESLSLMLWRSWLDDLDFNGKPNASEFHAFPLAAPSNITQAQGNYTFTLDDTDGRLSGGIVAGYVTGSDAAGNAITRGGGAGIDLQLFTYQLAVDLPASIPGEGGFFDGVHSWLHPASAYEISIPFNEPNGISDLNEVRFQLASNSVLDPLGVIWNATTNRCNATSSNLLVESCNIRSRSGELTPFSADLELRMEFTLDWAVPLEGELRRAPALAIVDRAEREVWLELPQLRWRFSPNLEIVADEVLLEVDSGTFDGQNAWVPPNAGMNISGRVAFLETGESPTLQFDVSILLNGERRITETFDGYFLAHLNAPEESRSHAMSFELTGLPPEANDATDPAATLFWIVVDGNAPRPVGVEEPREGSVIPIYQLSELSIELVLSEQEQLANGSLKLRYKVVRASQPNAAALIEGEVPLNLHGSPVGQSIQVSAILDIASRLPEDAYKERLQLAIWVAGSDMAGNGMLSNHPFNSPQTPFASWDIEQLTSEITITKVTYSRTGEVSVGQTTMVTIELRNTGHAAGTASLLIYEIGEDGENRSLTPVPISVIVKLGERTTYDIDWIPEDAGDRWVVVSSQSGAVEGDKVKVIGSAGDDPLGSMFEDVPMSWIVILAVLVLVLTAVVSVALRTGGSTESSLDGTDDWEDDDGWTTQDQEEDEPEPYGHSTVVAAQHYDQQAAQQQGYAQPQGYPQQPGQQQSPYSQPEMDQAQYQQYYQQQGQQPPQ